MLKTILVIYTNTKVEDTAKIETVNKYYFNTEADLKEGDMLKSTTCTTPIQVVKILDTSYKYYNGRTGQMSNEYSSTTPWVIRPLIVQEQVTTETVIATLIK